jgi:phosphatidylethanolamine/phosphatidyl-N-methylethanolamine N-methyltransferase
LAGRDYSIASQQPGGNGPAATQFGKDPAMQEASTKKIYDVHSVFYDATFGRLVKRRIERAINHMNISDTDRVLDIGIGTGVSLGFYPDRGQIIGVDLSAGMLREARKKIRERGLRHTTVFQANALQLPFADDTFDQVFISHVISVVSDPYQLIREAQRVSRPQARIVMVNHFQSTNRFIGMVEKWLCPLCTKLGWRSDLALQDLIRRTGVEIDFRYKLETVDLWETVVITNNKSAVPASITLAA